MGITGWVRRSSAGVALSPRSHVISCSQHPGWTRVVVSRRGRVQALARDAFADAAQLYEHTLEAQHFERAPDMSLRAGLLLRLGRARMAAGQRDQALEALHSALELVERLPTERRAEIVVGAATAYSSWPSVPDTRTPPYPRKQSTPPNTARS
jgi:hypothetical protein